MSAPPSSQLRIVSPGGFGTAAINSFRLACTLNPGYHLTTVTTSILNFPLFYAFIRQQMSVSTVVLAAVALLAVTVATSPMTRYSATVVPSVGSSWKSQTILHTYIIRSVSHGEERQRNCSSLHFSGFFRQEEIEIFVLVDTVRCGRATVYDDTATRTERARYGDARSYILSAFNFICR